MSLNLIDLLGGDASRYESITQQGVRMFAKLLVLTLAVFCIETYGGDVVVNPSASRLWSTVTEPQIVLPLPWPAGASTAVLSVPASGLFAGTEAVLARDTDASYVLNLPRPSVPGEEYLVSPTVEFKNANGETLAPKLNASLAVVCVSPAFYGTDVSAGAWTRMRKGSYVLPRPSNEMSLQVGYGDMVTTNILGECCAWMAFSPRKGGDYSLVLYGADGELSLSAMLEALATGLVFSVK